MNYNDDREYYNRNNQPHNGYQPQNDRMRNVVNERERRYDPQLTQQQEAFEPTIVGKGARITGTIEVAGDLVIQGEVQGDITCQNKISVTGVIDGNITTCDIDLDNAIITGDINCTGDLHLSETATVSGNCEAMNVVCGGRIKGDVNAAESATFEEKAALVGNLSARDIEIQKGAVLQGSVNIRQDVYFDTEK